MKLLCCFFVFLLCISCSEKQSKGIDKTRDSLQHIDEAIEKKPDSSLYLIEDPVLVARVMQKVLEIDKTEILDSAYLENEEFTENMPDGGASLTGYYHKGKLLKITEWIGLSYGVRERKYYFDNDKLIFLREKEDYFSIDSTGTDHSAFSDSFRDDHYFRNDSLIIHITEGTKRFLAERPDGKEFLETAIDYRKLLKSKKRK